MIQRISKLLICFFALCLAAMAQHDMSKKMSSEAMPDKTFLQKIWDGWATLDPANTAQFYAKGQHTFFDIAPVKYTSWDEYEKGVRNVLAGFQSATFTVNDDAQLHRAGDYVWGCATVKSDMTEKSGKRDLSTMRWTVVFQKQEGKWLIAHEHVSEPLP